MTDRLVTKNSWEEAVGDSMSEFFWSCVGCFVLGGFLVSGAGAFMGYVNTPQGEEPASNMMSTAVEYNKNVWNAVFFTVRAAGSAIHEMRPPAEENSTVK